MTNHESYRPQDDIESSIPTGVTFLQLSWLANLANSEEEPIVSKILGEESSFEEKYRKIEELYAETNKMFIRKLEAQVAANFPDKK